MAESRRHVSSPSLESIQRDSQKIVKSILTGDRERDSQIVAILLSAINAAHSEPDPQEAIKCILDMIVELTDADRGLLLLRDEDGKLTVAFARDSHQLDIRAFATFSKSVTGLVWDTEKSVCIIDTLEEEVTRVGRSVHEMQLRSIMCAPLRIEEDLVGVAYVDSRLAKPQFTDSDLTVFEALCKQVSVSLASERLSESMHSAQVASQDKGVFLANMSREIRPPLDAIIANLERLHRGKLTEAQRELTRTIRGDADALLAVANNLRDFADAEAGRLELSVSDFDLSAALEEITDSLALLAFGKGLELVCPMEASVPYLLRGDPDRLRQILLNLAENAIKFTHHGEVSIWVSCDSRDGRHVTLRFVITDTGIGIPEERLETIFDPFTQTHRTLAGDGSGAGLGLPLTRRLVERMGGQLGVESFEGQGSSIWFTVELEPHSTTQEPEELPPPELADKRVLVVDDSMMNRVWLTTLLESWGCRCSDAVSAEAALKALQLGVTYDDPYRLVLLDLTLPVTSGEELAQTIRGNPAYQASELMMMVPLDRISESLRIEKSGLASCISKPVKRWWLHKRLSSPPRR
ncbi:MAG: ATP-binding protein [bacterium]